MQELLPRDLSDLVWRQRYRADGEEDIRESWLRVARAVSSVEPSDRGRWEWRFSKLLDGFRFLPGGRILAGAGLPRDVTLFNCFVMGPIPDDMGGIFEALKEGALTMQQGGGVGYDYSTLRPAGLRGQRVGGTASGPVSFMRVWDTMCATVLSSRARRGAMMGALRCDHPDIEAFVDAKREAGQLRNFNLSVLVTDGFMDAVATDAPWPLVFPADRLAPEDRARYPARLSRRWPGIPGTVPCALIRELPARALWSRIIRAAYDVAEPGVLFIDRIQRENNLGYREQIATTNPCGEVPLPPYGACNLGSLNLTAFVREPFSPSARMDLPALASAAATATRMLDDVIDLSLFPLHSQEREALGTRRIGLGITGLADALILLGLRYETEGARAQAAAVMEVVCRSAYHASVALAREKGAFPYLDRGSYLDAPFVRRLPAGLREEVRRHGIRNSHLTAIAPAGSISLLAGNLSSGIEPVFARRQRRRVRRSDGSLMTCLVDDPTVISWESRFPDQIGPPAFVTAHGVAPLQHLAMQAAIQPFVDNAVSKTVNVPETTDFASFQRLYDRAYELGLKGCTIFRPNPITGAVLEPKGEDGPPDEAAGCCGAG